MSDEADDDNSVEQIAKIGAQALKALDSDDVVVKLQNGDEIEGTIVSFVVRKRVAKKAGKGKGGKGKGGGCIGNVSVQISHGVLEIDCLTIESIEAD
jgi:hypothetical protein